MTTWDEVEREVADAIFCELPIAAENYCSYDDYCSMARAAIRKMQELRLTAVVPDA